MSGKTRAVWRVTRNTARQFTAVALSAFLVVLVGCSSAQTTTSTGGGGTGSGTANVATISVNGGPEANYVNGAYTSVTICVPGSTTACQTISGILVDTGSYGLRIEASALTISPTQQTASGNAVVECAQFGSGFAWGPVQTVDFTIAGETAKSLPIQVMGSNSFPDSDTDADTCASPYGGAGESNPADIDYANNLGANGILGVGNFAQDCGTACATSADNPGLYYSCPTAATCFVTTEATASQVVNPVAMFATDNNGVIVELTALTGGEGPTDSGSLIFGIGTESNNGLGSATIYDVDPGTGGNPGNFTTVFGGVPYTDDAFVDSGSESLFFLDPATTGLPECTDLTQLYCPTDNANLSAENEGYSNGNSGTVSFTVANADSLVDDTSDDALEYLGGLGETENGTLYFDWGLPFFYGTNVYVAIDGASTPGGTGPYVAY